MPLILHISDLHRTHGPRIANDTLFEAIDNDSARWFHENIGEPDILVASGDIVQGVPLAGTDVDSVLSAQYEEAYDFMVRMTNRFFAGDRSRVVIVPGNHDVCWPIARSAMIEAKSVPKDLLLKLENPTSGIRWDWKGQQVYEIADAGLYESRLDHFRAFRQRFYEPLDPYPLAHHQDLLHIEYEEFNLAILGFSSWHGNDCFCGVGDIEPQLIADAQRVIKDSKMATAVAVWHHNIAGGPRDHDYMDDQVVHRLVDSGFVLGLHGHQHRADAAPYEVRLPNTSKICIVSAGSLCVGDSEIPTGEDRQFNLVDVRPLDSVVVTHVREMTAQGLFGPSFRMDFGGNSYMELELESSLSRPPMPTTTSYLDEAITAIGTGDYPKAIDQLDEAEAQGTSPEETRLFRIEALTQLLDWESLKLVIGDKPSTADEVMLLAKILMEEKDFNRARLVVTAAREIIDSASYDELIGKIESMRGIQ